MLPSAHSPVPSPDELRDARERQGFCPLKKPLEYLLLDSARHVLLQHGLRRCALRDATRLRFGRSELRLYKNGTQLEK